MALEGGEPIPERLTAPVAEAFSGPRKHEPLSDEVFASFLATASYTAGPLHATSTAVTRAPSTGSSRP